MHKRMSPHVDFDHMGDASVTTEKVFEDIKHIDENNNEYAANSVHYEVGKEVRNSIKQLGGTMPEDLPTPDRSLKELERNRGLENKNLE